VQHSHPRRRGHRRTERAAASKLILNAKVGHLVYFFINFAEWAIRLPHRIYAFLIKGTHLALVFPYFTSTSALFLSRIFARHTGSVPWRPILNIAFENKMTAVFYFCPRRDGLRVKDDHTYLKIDEEHAYCERSCNWKKLLRGTIPALSRHSLTVSRQGGAKTGPNSYKKFSESSPLPRKACAKDGWWKTERKCAGDVLVN